MGEPLNQPGLGDGASMSVLLPLVYEELRALASHHLSSQGERGHSLQPTALVHEAYLKMGSTDKRWTGRDHFMAVACIAMRQVLVDHARRKRTDKRGGGMARVDLSVDGAEEDPHSGRELRVLELHDLLTKLAQLDERAAQICEMRLFGGMSHEQIANVMGLSRMTVTTDWRFARAWLASRVGGRDDHDSPPKGEDR